VERPERISAAARMNAPRMKKTTELPKSAKERSDGTT
jgi:hypothetical protein